MIQVVEIDMDMEETIHISIKIQEDIGLYQEAIHQ